MYLEATTQLHKAVLKGILWLLLKNPENLDPKRNERERLEEALRINQPLATIYYIPEDLRQIWEQDNKAAAALFTKFDASRGGVGHQAAAEVCWYAGHVSHGYTGLLRLPDFDGTLEGTNNKIRTMQRQAYGFRDKEFFKLKIYALHRTKYTLIG